MSGSSSVLQIPTAEVFEPLTQPARYKGAYGGRGSGKSHYFAGLMVEAALLKPGFRGVCIREVQKSLKDSAKRLIEDKIAEHGLGSEFDIKATEIGTPGGGSIVFLGMQDHTAESIKSLEGVDVAWVEEAQTLSEHSLMLLRPTIRKDGSELWFSWNPRLVRDPVDVMFRAGEKPTGAVVVKANWKDNPWFPKPLEQERQDCLRTAADQYGHIWEGDYATILKGAYYAEGLTKARAEGRIGFVPRDPTVPVKAFFDPGGTKAIWIGQFVGLEIRWLAYQEWLNQPLSVCFDWLRANGYGSAECVLPHDAAQEDAILAVRFEDHVKAAGFESRTIKNQGKGAALKRVEAGRRLFPRMRFNEATTKAGLLALGAYHEHWDEKRNVGLGPEHDWSSHGADSFGLGCIAYEEPQQAKSFHRTIEYPQLGVA